MTGVSNQVVLFGPSGTAAYEPPVAREQPTSVTAGRRIRLPAKTFRGRVLAALREGPKTDDELCVATGLRDNSVRPRRIELVREGLVENSGHVRPTRSGNAAIVWRLREPTQEAGCRSS
ncbi:MAG: hypothetical protein K0V04_09040 [Deltaproteobacteria bacterium]|nr:hypothetical protein [Deltaproteobacteria bacterium]